MSASTSPAELLRRIRACQQIPPSDLNAVDFFHDIVEPLCDSFDPADAAAYERLMKSLIEAPPLEAAPPTNDIYVLSRVTLGADIKIVSIVLDAMRKRFSEHRIIFAGSRKSAELFEGIEYLEVNYPRSASIEDRVRFALALREKLNGSIVIDPDSRITQLGLIPLSHRTHHFHSRTAGSDEDNLTTLTNNWLESTFGVTGTAFINPTRVHINSPGPQVAISLGVGGNHSKRIAGEFEAQLIRDAAASYQSIWIDRGAGGEEAERVTAAAQSSGAINQIQFWEGSFAGFASIIQQSDYYIGYDSAGQHAAAAAGIPLTTYFAGAPSARFIARWSPVGAAPANIVTSNLPI